MSREKAGKDGRSLKGIGRHYGGGRGPSPERGAVKRGLGMKG